MAEEGNMWSESIYILSLVLIAQDEILIHNQISTFGPILVHSISVVSSLEILFPWELG